MKYESAMEGDGIQRTTFAYTMVLTDSYSHDMLF